MASEHLSSFSVCWDSFHEIISSGMNSLLENEDLVDVTLAIEGRYLKAHKMVLSVCSPYFKELFKTSPCKHPIVFMRDVPFEALSDLLQFMYKGEVQVSEENFETFIKTAKSLQIKGLSNYGNSSAEIGSKTQLEKNQNETHGTSPISKCLHLKEHIPFIDHGIVKNEPAVMEAMTSEEDIPFKTETYDDEEESSFEKADDNSNEFFFDDQLVETVSDKKSEHLIKQSGEERPLVYNMVETLATSLISDIDMNENLQNSKCIIKRKRAANFTVNEIEVLVEEVLKRRHVLFGSLKGPVLTQLHRDRAWEQVVMAVNKVSSVVRNLQEIKKKFFDLKTRTKQKVNTGRLAGISNMERDGLSVAERRLMSLIQRDQLKCNKNNEILVKLRQSPL